MPDINTVVVTPTVSVVAVNSSVPGSYADVGDYLGVQFGTGSPEGVVAAPVGDVYHQTDGSYGSVLWVKNSGSGATGWRVAKLGDGVFNVLDYGATGDGTTDDTSAIQAAVTAVNAQVVSGALVAQTALLYFPAAKSYRCSANLAIDGGCHVVMESPLVYTGAAHAPAITYGTSTSAGITFQRRLVLRVQRVSSADWTDTGDVGIKLINVQNSDVRIEECAFFTIGLQVVGSGAGVQYNRFGLGYFADNKYHVDIVSATDGAIGWVNENVWVGGNFSNSTAAHPGVSRYGIRITASSGSEYNNNNHFIKPAFQLNATDAGGGEAVPMLLEYAQLNRVYGARSEGCSATFARTSNLSSENWLDLGYLSSGDSSALVVDEQATYPVTHAVNARRLKQNIPGKLVFHSGPLHRLACYADGGTSINIPTVHQSTVAASAPPVASASGWSINSNYLASTSSRAVGIFVSCAATTEFVIRRDCESSYFGRVYVALFDSSGTQLQDTGTRLLTGTAYNGGAWSTNQGGSYQFSDSSQDVYIRVADAAGAAYLRIMVANATNPLRIRSFSVYALGQNGTAAAWVGVEEVVHRGNIGTAAPTSGTWEQGRIVWNSAPSAGGFLGWVCVTAGTPGTWKTFGEITA